MPDRSEKECMIKLQFDFVPVSQKKCFFGRDSTWVRTWTWFGREHDLKLMTVLVSLNAEMSFA